MAALSAEYMAILKTVLQNRFVPFLPPLLSPGQPVEQAAKQLSRAFSGFALHKLLDLTPHIACGAVVDDIQDKGLDAIYYDDQSEILYLLQAKLKASEQFKQEDALAFCEGVRLLLKQEFTSFNVNVQNRKVEIESALNACSHIRLVVPYTGDGVSATASTAMQALLDDECLDDERLMTAVLFYMAADITRDLLAEQAHEPVHAEVYLEKCEKIEGPRATYYGVAKMTDLVSLHQIHGKALYERNIRYFLGSAKSDVNKAIKATLRDNPADFFYLNNGVTAVCDLIEPKATRDGFKKLVVHRFSIINGAQTVASAAEFVAQNPDQSIADAKVMLTLIKATANGEFDKRVTKARNHQNAVQMANFASLDETQERLRQEMAFLNYYYHYRPETCMTVGINMITLDEALRALAMLQNDPRYLAWLKSEPARLTNPDLAEYKALFSLQLTGVKLINAVLCYREARRLILESEQSAISRSQERLVYRHGGQVIAAAMMKRLRTKIEASTLMKSEVIATLISQPLDQLRQEAFELMQQCLHVAGPLAYFRNQGNVASFLSDLMEKHYGLAGDPAIVPIRNITNAADRYPKMRLIDFLVSRAPQL